MKFWPRIERFPRIHRIGRRVWRVGWWTINGELPQRLRDRRASQSYDQWVRDYDSLDDIDRAAIREHIAALQWPVLISVVVPVYNTISDICAR